MSTEQRPPISWEMFLRALKSRYDLSQFRKLCTLHTTNIAEKTALPYAVVTFQSNGVLHRSNKSIISNFDYLLTIYSDSLAIVNDLSNLYVGEFVNKLDYVFADSNVTMVNNWLLSNVPSELNNIWRCDVLVSVQIRQPNYR